MRGPKYEQLQQAIKANELRPQSPTSENTLSSLPKVPLSLVVSIFMTSFVCFYTLCDFQQMSYLGIEPESESRTSFDFDSAVLLDGEAEQEIVIDCRRSVQFSIDSHESIYEKWKEKVAEDVEIVVCGTPVKVTISFYCF